MNFSETDLLERYLQAIGRCLPWNLPLARRQDILAELRANYESQLEERQADLGRPLTEGEMIDWLKQLGSPIHVASRYQPMQYLIGPTLFPVYLYVMRWALLLSMLVSAIVNAILLWTDAPHAGSLLEVALRVPGAMFSAAVWVTLTFAAIEFFTQHYTQLPIIASMNEDWTPTKLPPLDPVRSKGKKPRTYVQAAAEVIFGWLFLFWLLLVPRHPFLMFGPGAFALQASHIALAPVWWTFYWVAVAFQFAQNTWNTIDLVSGAWRSPSRLKPLFFRAGGLVTIGILLAAADHTYAMLRASATDAEKYAAVLNQMNPAIYHSMQLVFLIVAIQFVWEIIQLVRNPKP